MSEIGCKNRPFYNFFMFTFFSSNRERCSLCRICTKKFGDHRSFFLNLWSPYFWWRSATFFILDLIENGLKNASHDDTDYNSLSTSRIKYASLTYTQHTCPSNTTWNHHCEHICTYCANALWIQTTWIDHCIQHMNKLYVI